MSEQLGKLRQQTKNLRDELNALRQKHEYTIMQLADAKQNEQKLKKLNDSLMKSLESNTFNLQFLKNINIDIEGEFTSQKIAELERELDKYRNGVNASVDRRVREIIKGYSELEESRDKVKSAYSDHNNVSINYNVHKHQNNQQCQTCNYLKGLLQQKAKLIEELNIQIDQLRADTSILSSKLNKMDALVDTLRKENKLLQNQLSRLEYEMSQTQQALYQNPRNYYEPIEPKLNSRISFNKDRIVPSDSKDKENMMREISNIATVFSNRKYQEEKSKSRVMPVKDSNALFSIKNGINRPNQLFF